ncbi:bacteriochlorophyll/chlorophyll a synthase [Thiohalocapsa halophila]|uniref:Bacteriochlorophyll/chlorophyll a synthase n=1 Tax=Thiohalocapsa halophila TaxID=69359 RepID=A0ABS1CI76_9GAMM|nr:chlorophyll synthase ChlG [Thiohalocapsa halophila]MBK1631589.1 bacteriochlorophyll/chlorophyll a synthase [Thiohalocapsa halophila]
MTETASEQAIPARPQPKAMLEVLHPITWFPPMWAFTCGVVSSGVDVLEHWGLLIAGVILTGPLVCATSQVVNDWYDRDVDAINEPGRPIPSGRLPGLWGYKMAVTGTVLSLILGAALGLWVFLATVVGLIFAWIYSAPPLRLKNNGWLGNAAVGFSYETLAWITGAAVMLGGAMPDERILWLAFLYGLGAHGIMTLNDFKAIEGDRQLGVRTLPVQLGVKAAAWVACVVMMTPQFIVVGLLFAWIQPVHAAAVAGLVMVQGVLMLRFLENPLKRATWLSGLGVTVYVTGMMVSAFAVRAAVAGNTPL